MGSALGCSLEAPRPCIDSASDFSGKHCKLARQMSLSPSCRCLEETHLSLVMYSRVERQIGCENQFWEQAQADSVDEFKALLW